jgi:hypothetical protein
MMAVGGGVIGALRVVLGADTAAFETGLKKSASGLDKFAAQARRAAQVVATAMGLAAVGLGVAIRGQLAEADKLGKMAQSIGVPVEELSKLKHAADLSGVSLESLSKGVGRLNRNLVEGAQGLSTPIRAFEALGISIRNADGSLKTVSQALPEIADRFANMRDGPEKTALAMQLLGRAGAQLIPMLNLGAAGINELMQEAEQLGLVIDSKTAKAAEEFRDNLTRLARVKDGMITQITARLAPALAVLSERLVSAAKDADLMKSAGDKANEWAQMGARIFNTFAFIVNRVSIELGVLAQQWEALKNLDFAGFAAIGRKAKEEYDKAFSEIGTSLEKFWNDVAARGEANAPDQGRRMAMPMIVSAQETAKAQKEIEASAREAQRAWERFMGEGARVFEATRTPLENFQFEMGRLNALMLGGAIDADTYARAVAQLQDDFSGASQHAQQFAGAMESAFMGVVTQVKKGSAAARQLLADFARLAAQSAFRSLMGGFGNVFGGGGLKLPGFAGGGSFNVGGSGGTDSQLVAFKASPNERVSVTKPGQGIGGGITLSMPITISADGADPAQLSRLVGEVQSLKRELPSRVVAAVRDAKNRLEKGL